MEIFTSSWREYTGPGRVGICQGRPRGAPAGYRFYKPLAPSWDIIKNTKGIDDYRPRYFAEVLDQLDPHQVLEDIKLLANGHPPVLLCFEVTPLTQTNFCHRTMAGEWLAEKTGVTVTEWAEAKQPELAV
ncbi:hypothetical protein JQX09_17690 [Sulfitobacter pseudonitzschiae]|uniref:DUF488 domain-containing protein n=1 Tax=Pseudosulfitobacter pseudonitzschiae TaxID=1402135 RepID=A0A9Q2RWA3_9RHOB|nr:hypothetical protein [Pseudosulfitobacter pseudonitzschiae]MBM2293765.1 hypothetical protein [Pseudosulfitobacter pseudonitzschiae]MBM2298683.1 hypothetical protein [Pseudosulfitobacter pseudonitzschiae]MBM2303597.1 hypothetical protein [Pseudosulfitobacter pseudonitzschiae]MBM2313380.1 hypothetical protein [Pseudosulfitobacter pseudonitzschiae]MBM2318293.1 hypothetical protein [Pseudosulfitobacter pseudonitzschiae]